MIALSAKITLTNGIVIYVNNKNLINCNSIISDRGDFDSPVWGIISNTGNLEFNDTDGQIKVYAEKLYLKKNEIVEIFLENTLTGAKVKIREFKTDKWNYDNYNRVVSISLKDDLEEWQSIFVEGISYDPREQGQHKNFEEIYKYLQSKTPAKYKMISYEKLDEITKTQLKNTWLVYPLLESSNLWSQWDKFCYATQCHIYKTNNLTTCKYIGGN